MRRKLVVAALVSVATVVGMAGSAVAGEWAGSGKLITVNGRSECAYNGLDQDDDGLDPEVHLVPPGPPRDDELWAQSAAGGRVQSAGQIVTIFGPSAAGAPGQPAPEGCRPGRP